MVIGGFQIVMPLEKLSQCIIHIFIRFIPLWEIAYFFSLSLYCNGNRSFFVLLQEHKNNFETQDLMVNVDPTFSKDGTGFNRLKKKTN